MNTFPVRSAIVALALTTPMVFAQQTEPAPSTSSQAQAPQTPEEFDRQYAKMQQLMTQMNQQMSRLQQTQNPEQRQRLLTEHWTTMQDMMTMMQGIWGGTMGGCCGPGAPTVRGHMMGPMMMWGDYRNLTPEQLAQRQYMMDRSIPMQQMMMNQMMQQQYWQSQQQAPVAPKQ